ncbi:NUMOD1 domain-containing DNA-binding protein [Lactobacillus amylolyticus]|uniref:NUMOD1 domain-containing DNA-binding protein n=1 Tax=Lactobacillus amylolyticus TaxID=83683 RepID=UPI0024922A09|nr:NUMOD1 domain-containing DNA-binding protein [Lactobacillus amylolyticus]
MLSREAYKLIHQIDGGKDDFTRMMNWRHIKDDDPRLKKLRKEINRGRPGKRVKTPMKIARYASETVDADLIEKMLLSYQSAAEIARAFNLSRQTIYLRIIKSKRLLRAQTKAQGDINRVVIVKKGKKQIFRNNREVAKFLKCKAQSIADAKSKHTKYKGFKIYRYLDWRKSHE